MKREDIKAIFAEATDEQLKRIMDLNGADVEKVKGRVTALEAELKEKNTALENLNGEFEKLNRSSATAEDYKSKLETLQNEIAEREQAREAEERETAERAEFDKYFADNNREWSNPFIADGYFGKFKEAKKAPENSGKVSADILHELTKDDKTAFKGVTAEVKLPGVQPLGGVDTDAKTAKARAVLLSIGTTGAIPHFV